MTMRTLIQGFILGGVVGLLVGLAVASKRRAPDLVRPSAREVELESQVARLREDLEASRLLVRQPVSAELPPAVPPPVPPAVTPAKARIEAPVEWRRRAESMTRIADLLALELPEGETRQAAWSSLMGRARQLLKEPEAQTVLLSDLYTMSTSQLVMLYDVFWTADLRMERGFSMYGNGFAAVMSGSLLELYRNGHDAGHRRFGATMLFPDTRHLSDRKLREFRSLLEVDPDPSMRGRVQNLPVRPD